jgi:serine/threonine protein kinase
MTTTHAPPDAMTRDQFVAAVRACGVLSSKQLTRLDDALSPFLRSPRELADHLIRERFLSRFQAERLLAGRTDGFLIGPYAVLDYLGKTDASRAYKARHRTMNRLVEIQILTAAATATDDQRTAVHTAARAAARLAHPNVITLLDVNAIGGRVYLVREYVDGTDLGAVAKGHGPMPVGRVCEFVRQAAHGLSHAHERDTVHGRLTPASIRVGRPGGTGPEERPVVKVGGLGLGLLAGDPADGGFEHLAPELFEPAAILSAEVDVYALGSVFHLALTGLPPHPAASYADAERRRHAPLQPVQYLRPDLPAAVAAVLAAMLSNDPAARPTAAAVAEAVEPFAGEDAAAAVDFALSSRHKSGPISLGAGLSGLIPQEVSDTFVPNPWADLSVPTATTDTGDETKQPTVRVESPPPSREKRTAGDAVILGLSIAAGLAVLGGLAVAVRLVLG